MCDYREKFYNDIRETLVINGYNSEEITDISNIVLLILNNYEITNRTTELTIYDDSNEKLIKMYISSFIAQGNSKKSAKAYMSIIKRFLLELDKPLTEATAMDCRIWLAKLQNNNNVSTRTCENYRSYICAFYQWLYENEMIIKNPMLTLKPLKFQNKVKKAFKEIEVDRLRNACVTLRDRAEIEMLLSTGCRVSELSSLNIEDVNFITNEVLIREGKGNKQRTVYINDIAKFHLQEYLNSRSDTLPFLLVSKHKTRVSKDIIERDVTKIGKRANIQNVHPHRFRRTFASTLYNRGMDVRSIQTILGHSNLNTTMIYISVDDTRVKSQYNKFIV